MTITAPKISPGEWTACCQHIGYTGGDWSHEQFLQWELDGPEAPAGRGTFYQEDAVFLAAGPEVAEALIRAVEHSEDGDDYDWIGAAMDALRKAGYVIEE
jgi:hypothetical protein